MKEKILTDREILDNVMNALGVNSYGFSRALQYENHGSVYNVGREKKDGKIIKLGKSLINRILKYYPNVSINYLKYGTGDILLSGKALIAQTNALGALTDQKQLTLEQEIKIRLEEIENKLDRFEDLSHKLDIIIEKMNQ